MGFHLYCIVPSGHAPPGDLRGIEERPVEALDVAPFAVWTSSLERSVRPSLDRIRVHDRVIRAAVSEEVTPLPVRFGQWLPDSEAVRTRISDHVDAYQAALREVAGSVEFGVRLLARHAGGRTEEEAPPASDGVGAGRAYLRALARRRAPSAEAEALMADLQERIGSLAKRSRMESGGRPGELVQVAHLVHRRDASRYREALAEFRRSRPELRTVVSGPWPPYSFGP